MKSSLIVGFSTLVLVSAAQAQVYDGFNGGLYQEDAIANGYVTDGEVPDPVYGTDYWGGNARLNQPGSGLQGISPPWPNSNRRTGTGWNDLTMGSNSSSGPNNNQYRRQTGWRVEQPGANFLTSTGLAYGALPTTGGAFRQLANTGNSEAGRNVGTTYADQAGESGWGSFIYNRTSGTNDDWGGFGLFKSNVTETDLGDDPGYNQYSGINNSSERALLGMPYGAPGNFGSTVGGSSSVLLNQQNFVVFQVMDTGAGDVLKVWLNPSLSADLSTLTPDITGSAGELAFDAVRLRNGGGGNWTWDEIRIGSSAADVGVVVPEPASAALLVLGAAVLGLRRRHA